MKLFYIRLLTKKGKKRRLVIRHIRLPKKLNALRESKRKFRTWTTVSKF